MPNLFGEEPASRPSHVKAFIEHFSSGFLARHGSKYPWRGRDFAAVRDITDATGDSFRPVIDAYLADGSPRYEGHELRWLLADLARFASRAKQHRGGTANGNSKRTPGNASDAIL